MKTIHIQNCDFMNITLASVQANGSSLYFVKTWIDDQTWSNANGQSIAALPLAISSGLYRLQMVQFNGNRLFRK
jgi:hypothetical protein